MFDEIYRIPQKVPQGSRIAIWGAGKVGKYIYEENLKRNYYEIVLWVDRNWDHLENDLVCNPEELKEIHVDYVIIAVDAYSTDIARRIKMDIKEYGFSEAKILGPIWRRNSLFEKERQMYKSASSKEVQKMLQEWRLRNDISSNYSEELVYLILKGAFNADGQEIELKSETRHFLITGAGFHNSGAEAMLFTVVENIRRRDPNAFIWFFPADRGTNYSKELQKRYKFCFWLDNWDEDSLTQKLMAFITAIIDVSGYALYSGANTPWYRKILEYSNNYSVPLYLMPQSFGPFDEEDYENSDLKRLLENARIIYARESSGYQAMTEGFGLTNVILANDIVLTAKPSEYSFVLKDEKYIRIPNNSVAVIPNSRLFEKMEDRSVIEIYTELISTLHDFEKNIYIINHAGDEVICKKLYEMNMDYKEVYLLEERVDAVQFPVLVEQFEYIVASRYHSIVQAYKKNVPCLVIGWANKYRELMKKAGQEQYCFDVRKLCEFDELELTLRNLNKSHCYESRIISERICNLNEECFGFLDEILT